MPKRITTCALTLLDKDDLGGITLGVNAKAAPGASIIEWSVDWDDEETEDNTIPLPSTAKHSYIEGGARLIILSVKDSKGKITSTGLNVLITRNPVVAAPSDPSSLNSSLISNTQINLVWNDTSNNETGFELQRQTDGGSFINLTQLPFNTTSFQDLQVTSGHTYTYRIRAFNAGGFSGFSNTTSQTTGVQTYDFIVAPTTASPAGNDSNPGTLAAPFATITKGMQAATVALSGTGKTVGVRTGTFDQSIINPSAVSGTSNTNKVIVKNYNGETVTMRPTSGFLVVGFYSGSHAYLEFDGINMNGTQLPSYEGVFQGFGASGADNHHITVKNAECTGKNGAAAFGAIFCGPLVGSTVAFGQGFRFNNLIVHGGGSREGQDHGFYCSGSDVIIDTCECYDFVGAGIQTFNNSDVPGQVNVILRNNTCHNPKVFPGGRHWGIICGCTAAQLYCNVMYDIQDDGNQAAGISLFGSTNAVVVFNTATRCKIGIHVDSCTGAILRNNIAYANGSSAADNLVQSGDSGTIQSNNSFDGTNPQFVGATNFHLTAGTPNGIKTGGVAIGSGEIPPAGITTDHDGVLYANPPSIGAYQFV